MPVCCSGAKCRCSNLPVNIKTHCCYYCKQGVHAICAIELEDTYGERKEECLLCHESKFGGTVDLTAVSPFTPTVEPTAKFVDPNNHRIPAVVNLKLSSTYVQPPYLVDNKDITVIHSKWVKKADIPQGTHSPFWKAFHVVLKEHTNDAYPDLAQSSKLACCNLCGGIVVINGGATPLKRHFEKDNNTLLSCKSDMREAVYKALDKDSRGKITHPFASG